MALNPGTSIGHCDVTALLGEGGMGQVWQAVQVHTSARTRGRVLRSLDVLLLRVDEARDLVALGPATVEAPQMLDLSFGLDLGRKGEHSWPDVPSRAVIHRDGGLICVTGESVRLSRRVRGLGVVDVGALESPIVPHLVPALSGRLVGDFGAIVRVLVRAVNH